MSFIEMIHSGILFKNPKPYLKSVQAYFPSVVQCDNGDFVAAAVVGEAFEAVNLRNILFRSKDNGATWELQGPLYEPEPGKTDIGSVQNCEKQNRGAFRLYHAPRSLP